MISWQLFTFSQLSTHQLYELIKLRIDVFVVEQNCPYPELDEKDRHSEARHLLGMKENKLVAYSRLLPKGLSYPSISIGRVVTLPSERGGGTGRLLMQQSLQCCEDIWPGESIEIGAQAHLEKFYASFGFVSSSDIYEEDGIPHLDMKLMKT